MIGFLIGTMCLFGLLRVLRGGCGYGRRWGHGRGGCGAGWGGEGCGAGAGWGGHGGPGRWGQHRGWGGEGWEGDEGPGRGRWRGAGGPRVWLRAMFERLDTTPGQEKAIVQAISEVREAMGEARGELQKARADVAKAVRAEVLDHAALGEATARVEAAAQRMREIGTAALSKVHESLDEKQRAALADLIEAGAGPFGRRGGEGPYRTWA